MGCFANDEFVVFDCTVHNRIVGSQNETETDFKLGLVLDPLLR